MTTAASTASTVALTDTEYEVADRIDSILDADRTASWTPSRMARKAKTDTYTAGKVLDYMVKCDMAVADGNGAWTHYSYRPLFTRRAAR